MNIELFIARRKALGLSQKALSDGICTQATLSKFENNGKAPAIRIVAQLCQRLHLQLEDVFPTERVADAAVLKELATIEFDLITSEYTDAENRLSKITDKPRHDLETKLQYCYLKGYVAALNQHPISDVLFNFDQIITDLDEPHATIYTQLAYCGTGIAYQNNHEPDKAEYYFEKVRQALTDLSLETTASVWRVINLAYYTGNFYAKIGEETISRTLLAYAITVCAEHHVTYYVAKIKFLQAQLSAGGPEQQELLSDACAFARINNNRQLLKKITNYSNSL
ncbi:MULTISPECIES: helix-turn-helix domain-containing protein [Lactiplantibacillus]|jgi:transcriptional regulator with XRE-family HTH domain|uniref:Helix-turn-helix domain-containing protein n=2 Tax=Lactiplantibacillus TaxID=2767842 RepID=A0ABW1R285_9LACO|nr:MULTISPECIES: helix-turn-helix transcriptional regulator [Lactiplantibacillus]